MDKLNRTHAKPGMHFGLMYFSSGEDAAAHNRYRLVLDGARFADQHGFASVWIPERHFTKVGCLFPNPAVLHAAIARETSRIHLRAGSVVVPLHHPIRIAEEWALVDNLSNGRVGLSFASGWHPDDFVFAPEKYTSRHAEMYKGIETIQKLWQGEAITCRSGDGRDVELHSYPRPIQKTLPYWLTAAGNPKTFAQAGAMGAHLLTHLFNQSFDEAEEKIAIYRKARADHGHDPETGHVAVQVQTFIGSDLATSLNQSRGPFLKYLESSAELVKAIAFSQGQEFDPDKLSARERDLFLNFVYERLLDRVLFGTPESCFPIVERIRAIGVNEIACQVDFGVDIDLTLQSLPHLHRLKEMCDAAWGCPALPTGIPLASERPITQITTTASAPLDSSKERPAVIQARCPQHLTRDDYLGQLRRQGIQFPGTPVVEEVWQGTSEALVRVQTPEILQKGGEQASKVQPAFLELCVQALLATIPASDSVPATDDLFVPGGFRGFKWHSTPGSEAWAHAAAAAPSGKTATIEGDVRLLNEAGGVLAEVVGLKLQRVQRPAAPGSGWARYADWFYALRWEAIDSVPAPAVTPRTKQNWLILNDRTGVGNQLAKSLISRGDQAVLVESMGIESIKKFISTALGAEKPKLDGIIFLWGLDAAKTSELNAAVLQADQERGVDAVLELVQALTKWPEDRQPRLWIGTRGAQAIGATTEVAISQAPLWGLGRTIALEEPRLWGGLIDLDPANSVADSARHLFGMLERSDRDDQIVIRGEQRFAPRLGRMREAPTGPKPFRVRADGSYWVAGGSSGIGLEVARWLVGQGAKHLVLIGRTPLPPREEWARHDAQTPVGKRIQAVQEMEGRGAKVHCAAVDVADEQALAALQATLARAGSPPVRGIVHTAVQWLDCTLRELDQPRHHGVMRPKVAGAWALHRLHADAPLDFFVVFSSAVSFLPAIGQGSYAAANAFLDALAFQRRAEGRPALCLNSGPWAEVGLSATDYGQKILSAQGAHGIQPMTPKQGLDVVKTLLEHGLTQAGVLNVDWPVLAVTYSFAVESPVLGGLTKEERNKARSTTGSSSAKARNLKGFVTPRNELEQLVANVWQEVLSVDKVGAFDNFFALGGHSIRAAIAANKLQEILGEKIHFVSLFDAQTVADLAVYLNDRYPEAVARHFGREPVKPAAAKSGKVDAAKLAKLRQAVADWPIHGEAEVRPGAKNPPVIFVLSAPRSGSTLFRVMLGGHTKLFSPPELHLMSFPTLADRRAAFTGRNSYRTQGTIRALQELHGWSEENARQFMDKCETEGWSTQRFYQYMQDTLGQRVLVDKTPHYAMDIGIMQRCERYFENAMYVHLVRHPYGMIRSWEEVRMDAVFSSGDDQLTSRELGELTWLLSNQNIVDFLEEVPRQRQIRVRYEDLVKDPVKGSELMCKFLGLEFDPAMVEPYKDSGKRMTDGRGHLGDPNFHKHQGIDAARADRWMETYQEEFLCDATLQLADAMGYARLERRSETPAIVPAFSTQAESQVIDHLANASEIEVDALLKDLLAGARPQ